MNYEKEYRSIVEKLKNALLCIHPDGIKKTIEDILHESNESEDERIYNLICSSIKNETPIACPRNKELALAYLEKQKEQELHLTVKGKGVYKICPHCKSRMIRDDSKVYTSMPPQYGYNCPKCGTMEFDTIMYDSPEMKEQQPALRITNGFYEPDGPQFDIVDQNPAEWSEEDEKVRDSTIEYIDSGNIYATSKVNMITWLKYLPERFNLQPKQEWSEEDEAKKERLISIVKRALHGNEYPILNDNGATELITWLKSLRPQPHWKPSEEQMNVLLNAEELVRANNYPENAKILASLYEQLKKL